jgi:hypothetical protein
VIARTLQLYQGAPESCAFTFLDLQSQSEFSQVCEQRGDLRVGSAPWTSANAARKLVHVRPMSYEAFCGACHLDPNGSESFTRFSIVGGIPKYWEFVDPRGHGLKLQADNSPSLTNAG